MRLQKALAALGVASRRQSEALILAGRVKVNGQSVTALGTKVILGKDRLEVDGKPLPRFSPKVYFILNKPPGYLTTSNDPQGRKKAIDLLPKQRPRVFAVGRLDYESEGLLLFTNDGELAYRLTHPCFQIPRVYHAWVKGTPSPQTLATLAQGVPLAEGKTAPAKVRVLKQKEEKTLLALSLKEGKKREVRRMCAITGHPVLSLKRVQFGPLSLGNLKRGEWRFLSPAEEARLKRAVGLGKAKHNKAG